jgi:hypothetical protein
VSYIVVFVVEIKIIRILSNSPHRGSILRAMTDLLLIGEICLDNKHALSGSVVAPNPNGSVLLLLIRIKFKSREPSGSQWSHGGSPWSREGSVRIT